MSRNSEIVPRFAMDHTGGFFQRPNVSSTLLGAETSYSYLLQPSSMLYGSTLLKLELSSSNLDGIFIAEATNGPDIFNH